MPKQKEENYQLVIDQLTANTKELLTEYYARANTLRDEKDTVKIAVSHRVTFNQFGEIITHSQIGFGKRVKDSVEHTVDMTGQLDFEGKNKKEEKPDKPEKVVKETAKEVVDISKS